MPVPHQNHLFMSGDDSAIHVERINDLLEPLCGFPGIRNMCRFLKILEYLLNLHRCFCVINIFFLDSNNHFPTPEVFWSCYDRGYHRV